MEKELHKKFIKEDVLSELKNNDVLKSLGEMQRTMAMYRCAIKEVQTKFEVLNEYISSTNNRNPIEVIKSRLKKPESIIGKLVRRELPVTMESITENLNDVAGVRVICSFIEDIYTVAKMFARQDDIKVLEVKDYIKKPKPNGYRSYHMIVEIPVFFSDSMQNMKVEVQLRTIAMDFWASLEHQMKYKKDIENAEEIIAELKSCAEIIASTDEKMQNISKRIFNS